MLWFDLRRGFNEQEENDNKNSFNEQKENDNKKYSKTTVPT